MRRVSGVPRGGRTGVFSLSLILGAVQTLPCLGQSVADPAAVEFFEKEVRPILATRCQTCHGPDKQKGGLRLDSRAAVLKGGDNGPVVVPGKPSESALVDAINYGETYQMPPKSKLPAAEIAALTKWVAAGLPWPETPAATASTETDSAAFSKVLQDRKRRHWSFQPVVRPAVPAVKDASWPLSPVDAFLLAALEAKGLRPAAEADRRALIRRLYFDLAGLPPSVEEIDAFLKDARPNAYEMLVERLLASPGYGERWGRHWLDLARFAESAGHEFDYDVLAAFRYRDYVVRAINADLPYDAFVREHIAGDLIENPRRHPVERFNESVLGTGFYFLGEGTHSPVDLKTDEAFRVDNQIDVLSKTFLGLTLSCARCHDHKFDPISTKDYYAIAGRLRSTRFQQAFLDAPERIDAKVSDLAKARSKLSEMIHAGMDRDALSRVERILASAAEVSRGASAAEAIKKRELDPALLDRVVKAIQAEVPPSGRAAGSWETFETFDGTSLAGWKSFGQAFGDRPSRAGDVRIGSDGVSLAPPGCAHSGLISDRLQGVLRSRTFTIRHKYIHTLAAGKNGRINVVVDSFEKIRSPIYGGLTVGVNHGDRPRWVTQDAAMWVGSLAYIELADGASVNYTEAKTSYFPGDGHLAVDEIVFSDDPNPPASSDAAAAAPGALAAWAARNGLLEIKIAAFVKDALAAYRTLEAAIPEPTFGLAASEGTGIDDRVRIRGNPRMLGEPVPRRFLEALSDVAASPSTPDGPRSESGRLELAQEIAHPSNPLTARVLVNRLWKHHFGEGLVKTPDDFGAMGRPPTHPALLDWLASEFASRGWSIKSMHRLLVNSRAYRMSSAFVPGSPAETVDPNNELIHRANVKRLEAEAIRDALLAISGRLDSRMEGPSVLPYLTPFMDGRGKPGASGPLDGNGRRSIYINIRRNFLPPLFLTFDFPSPASTMGRRNVSNVPAQALSLLNDPFVVEQADLWAARLLSGAARSRSERLNEAYVSAFGRPPSDRDRARALAFLDGSADGPDSRKAWAELCHVLINAKEFLFVN